LGRPEAWAQQLTDSTDDRPEETSGLERALLEVLVEDQGAEKAPDERTDDAENDCLDERHGIAARDEQAGEAPATIPTRIK
jgi:hypothetical protein